MLETCKRGECLKFENFVSYKSFFVGSKHWEYSTLKSFFKSLENLINFVFKDVVGLKNLEQFFFSVQENFIRAKGVPTISKTSTKSLFKCFNVGQVQVIKGMI